MTLVRITLVGLFAANSGLIARNAVPKKKTSSLPLSKLRKPVATSSRRRRSIGGPPQGYWLPNPRMLKQIKFGERQAKESLGQRRRIRRVLAFLCQSGKKFYIKNSWPSAKSVDSYRAWNWLKVNRHLATTWLANRITTSRHPLSF